MTREELKKVVDDELKQMNLISEVEPYGVSYYSSDLFSKKEEHVVYDGGDYYRTNLFGKNILVHTCYRRNGTDEDVNVKMIITNWNGISGKQIATIKLLSHHTEKTIIKKVRKFIEENYK